MLQLFEEKQGDTCAGEVAEVLGFLSATGVAPGPVPAIEAVVAGSRKVQGPAMNAERGKRGGGGGEGREGERERRGGERRGGKGEKEMGKRRREKEGERGRGRRKGGEGKLFPKCYRSVKSATLI